MVLRLALATALVGIAWMAPAEAQTKQKAVAANPAPAAPTPKASPAVGQLAGTVNVTQSAADVDSEATAGPAKQRPLKLK